MKEVLRIKQGAQNYSSNSILRDYNLEVYAGEIVYIQGLSGSGVMALIDVLSGKQQLSSGEIYIQEKKLQEYSENTFLNNGIYTITAEQDLVNNLTVAENLEAVREQRFLAAIFSRKKVISKVDEYLFKEEIKVHADSLVQELTLEDKQKLSILKAKMNGAALIVLDCTRGYYEGRIAEELCTLIQKISDEGIAFIILSERYSSFAEISDHIQIMHLGRDMMEWDHFDEKIKITLTQKGNIQSNYSRSEKKEIVKSFYGLYDYYWGMDYSIWEYLAKLKKGNSECWKTFINVRPLKEGTYYDGETAIIPKESASLLIPNLDVDDNIIITIPQRISKNKYGIVKKKLASNVSEGFYQRTGLNRNLKKVSELSDVHKKILSIYRWEVAKPKTIIFENPYCGMDTQDIAILRKYMEELSGKGIRVICFSKSLDEMKSDCCVIISTEDGLNATLL